MSSDSGDGHKFDWPDESNYGIKRKLKISYARDFLLSLSRSEKCMKLPSGFDESILREFEDTSFERSRIPGSLLSHGFRRNEYGSSPPTKGEVGNYSRGIPGRWESRSSVRSDKETDSQSDLDSDPGKHFANPARRGWQAREHDGLLGSGSFPRPAGYTSGTSAPKLSSNDNYQLNKSTEPYQPPRPYKAVPHFRRETKDSYNDETFGASDFTSEDKAEEERKRRDSFELMRKEQHKAFQERQKMNIGKHKDVFETLLEDSRDEKRALDKGNDMDEPTIVQESTKDPPKSSVPLQSLAARPLVPPGFAGAMQEKKSHPGEVKMLSADNISHASENIMLSVPPDYLGENQKADQMGLNMNQYGRSPDIRSTPIGKTDKDVLPALDISDPPGKKLYGSDMHPNVLEPRNSEVVEINSGKAVGNQGIGQSSRPATILEELFGSPLALEAGGFSTVAEQYGSKTDDTWSPRATQSSKFAQWFLEEADRKPQNDPISRPPDLFSLIVRGERTASESDRQSPEQRLLKTPFLGSQVADDSMASETISKSDSKPETVSAVLTCEDLENSILLGIGDGGAKIPKPPSPQLPLLQGMGGSSEKLDPPSAKNVDNRASEHLLSLLQKGTMHNGVAASAPLAGHPKSTNKIDSIVAESVGNAPNRWTEAHDRQSLTLETLFGTAFMKELQSVGAPVSVQKGLADGIISGGEGEPMSYRNGHEGGALALNQGPPIEEQFLLFENLLQPGVNIPQLQAQVRSKHGMIDGQGEIRLLPEEDSLIAVGDPLNLRGLMPGDSLAKAKAEVLSSQGAPSFDIAEKIAALNGNFSEQRYAAGSEGGGPLPTFHHVPPFDNKREAADPFQNLHMRPHPQLPSHHRGTNFSPLDSYHHPGGHGDSQMKMLAPEQRELQQQSRHHFPPNRVHPSSIHHHPNSGFSGFDSPNHHPHHILAQQMHMAGHYPTTPPHPIQEFVRGGQPQDNHRGVPGFVHDLNPVQAFPFGHRRPNVGALDNMPLLGGAAAAPPEMGGGGNNQPEALQRLIEMDLRSNAKQVHHHPAAAAGGGGGGGGGGVHSNQALFGHERDVGFRYR